MSEVATINQPMKSQGTKLAYESAPSVYTEISNLTSIGELNQTSNEIDVTTLGATGGYRQYMQGFKDAGQITLEGFFTPSDDGQKQLNGLYQSGEVENWQIEFVDGTKVQFSAYVMGIAIGPVEVDGAPRFNTTLRVTGPIDIVEKDA